MPVFRGLSQSRLEDERFLTGKGTYVSNGFPERCLQAHVVRSLFAHARIVRIDTAPALRVPGIVGVFTEGDLAADGIGPLPCITVLDAIEPIIVPPRPALAKDVVRHVGDPVAFIVAESMGAALEAAEAIEIEYDSLPCVVEPTAALSDDAPQIWPQAKGNSAFLYRKGDASAVEKAFAAAAHVVSADLVNSRVVVAPIETRAAIGAYDAGSDVLHLILTGQAVHGIRKQLADSVFRIPVDRMRLTVPDVGGGFGMKNFVYPEWALVLYAARKLGRPVRWISERTEDFVSSTHGRDYTATARLALDSSGRFLALGVQAIANMGAYLSSNGPLSPTSAAASAMGGVYDIPSIFLEVRGAFTNTPPLDAYRGAGKPEANYIIERLVDLAAKAVGVDSVDLRRRNIISSFPHVTAMGMKIDGGRFAANLEDAVRAADRAGFEGRRKQSADRGLLRGMGVSCFLETARGAPNEVARVAFLSDNTVSIAVGTQSNGQGHETAYPQIAADMLGLPLSSFRFLQGDTGLLPSGGGHGGARSMHLGGTALVIALEALIEKGRRIAAHLLQTPVDRLQFVEGVFKVRGSERSIGLVEIAVAARDPTNLPEGMLPGLEALENNISDLYTFPNGCHVAEVEIEPETGNVRLDRYLLVDDFGALVNPMLTLGQVHGGVAQGIGQALLENVVFDADSGQLLSGSMMDYALPRASDLPSFGGHLSDKAPTKSNRLGVKGSGQAGCMASPQTVMNAVLDALLPLGVKKLDMPATPFAVWQAIQSARAL
ncbi:MAG: xanthine dehydrogenase family protein [Proteobacteria bacterium]|nr:xanthine dehydrogenase family protein [Pseudomonadota bacterium]